MTRRCKQSGFALFEVLISVVVASLGFLALAGLSMKGLRDANSSMLRSKAVELAYQMTDRVRANAPGAQAGFYNALVGAATNPGCISTSCTTAQMAQNDFNEWLLALSSALPSGTGVVCVDSTPDDGAPGDAQCDNVGGTLIVKIWWTEKTAQYRFTYAFRP
jgi:type IV pilus assembly protein PilV